jgi:hypothetical protein
MFALALAPSIFSDQKPNVFTSLITSIGLGIMSVCLFTLSLYYSTIISAICTILWGILLIQGINKDRQIFESNNECFKDKEE